MDSRLRAFAVPGECNTNNELPRGVRRAYDAGALAKAGGASKASRIPLFVYDLDLLIDHSAGKPVDRNMHPIALLAFDNELCEVGFAWRVFPALSDHINQQIPGTRLIRFPKRASNGFALRLWYARTQSS